MPARRLGDDVNPIEWEEAAVQADAPPRRIATGGPRPRHGGIGQRCGRGRARPRSGVARPQVALVRPAPPPRPARGRLAWGRPPAGCRRRRRHSLPAAGTGSGCSAATAVRRVAPSRRRRRWRHAVSGRGSNTATGAAIAALHGASRARAGLASWRPVRLPPVGAQARWLVGVVGAVGVSRDPRHVLDREEIVDALLGRLGLSLADAFRALDRNCEGFISQAECGEEVREAVARCPPGARAAFYEEIGVTGRGYIPQRVFRAARVFLAASPRSPAPNATGSSACRRWPRAISAGVQLRRRREPARGHTVVAPPLGSAAVLPAAAGPGPRPSVPRVVRSAAAGPGPLPPGLGYAAAGGPALYNAGGSQGYQAAPRVVQPPPPARGHGRRRLATPTPGADV